MLWVSAEGHSPSKCAHQGRPARRGKSTWSIITTSGNSCHRSELPPARSPAAGGPGVGVKVCIFQGGFLHRWPKTRKMKQMQNLSYEQAGSLSTFPSLPSAFHGTWNTAGARKVIWKIKRPAAAILRAIAVTSTQNMRAFSRPSPSCSGRTGMVTWLQHSDFWPFSNSTWSQKRLKQRCIWWPRNTPSVSQSYKQVNKTVPCNSHLPLPSPNTKIWGAPLKAPTSGWKAKFFFLSCLIHVYWDCHNKHPPPTISLKYVNLKVNQNTPPICFSHYHRGKPFLMRCPLALLCFLFRGRRRNRIDSSLFSGLSHRFNICCYFNPVLGPAHSTYNLTKHCHIILPSSLWLGTLHLSHSANKASGSPKMPKRIKPHKMKARG